VPLSYKNFEKIDVKEKKYPFLPCRAGFWITFNYWISKQYESKYFPIIEKPERMITSNCGYFQGGSKKYTYSKHGPFLRKNSKKRQIYPFMRGGRFNG